MKNRNIPYYAAALLMAAGLSTSMVSCVDTDEPESIALLRQAKANEVNAKASLLNAQASEVLANIDINKSAAALSDKAQELKNAYQELVNAKKKADDAVANAKSQLELDSLNAKKDSLLLVAQLNVAKQVQEAKAALEVAKIKAQTDVIKKQNDILIETKKIAVALAKFNANGDNNELKNAATAYKTALDDEAAALKDLNNAYKAFCLNKGDIEDAIEEATDKVETATANKADFEAKVKANELGDWLDEYYVLQEKIDKNEPTLNSLEYQKLEKEQKRDAIYTAPKDGESNEDQAKAAAYNANLLIGNKTLESLIDLSTLKFEAKEDSLKYNGTEKLTNSNAKDQIEKDYENLSNQLTAIISDLKQKIEQVAYLAEQVSKSDYDAAKETLTKDKGAEYKAWQTAVTAYNDNKADRSKTGQEYQDLVSTCNDFFSDGTKYLDFVLNTNKIPTYEEVLAYFGNDKKKADDFYYDCGSVFANANIAIKNYEGKNDYAEALESATNLKKAIDGCDFGASAIADAIAADEALKTEEYNKLQEEIDELDEQIKNNSTDDWKALQDKILGFKLTAELYTKDDEDNWKDKLATATFDDGTLSADKFKEAYDYTVAQFDADIELYTEAKAALEEILKAFEAKEKEGKDVDFGNGCELLELFFDDDATNDKNEWLGLIKDLEDKQVEYAKKEAAKEEKEADYNLLVEAYADKK